MKTVPPRKRTRPYFPLHEDELGAIEHRLEATEVRKATFLRAAVLLALENEEVWDAVIARALADEY